MEITLELLEKKMSELTNMKRLLNEYIDEVYRLPTQDVCLIISDFDDTIFSKQMQMECEPLLKECEPHMRNSVIMYKIGVPIMIEKYYKGEIFPPDIISLMNPSRDLILSAGIESYQQQKLQALGLSHFPLKVVKEPKDKILASIQYILYTLKYIPSEIIIYEDKPHYFIEYRQLIE
jgi:hypothetical protein